jgi:hypothetical protein
MGLELSQEPDPVAVHYGFVCIGEQFTLAINPEAVSKLEPKPQRDDAGEVRHVEVVIHYIDGDDADRVFVLRFADLLRAFESALQWRRSWPNKPS